MESMTMGTQSLYLDYLCDFRAIFVLRILAVDESLKEYNNSSLSDAEKIKNPVTFSPFVRYWGETARKGGKDDETGL